MGENNVYSPYPRDGAPSKDQPGHKIVGNEEISSRRAIERRVPRDS